MKDLHETRQINYNLKSQIANLEKQLNNCNEQLKKLNEQLNKKNKENDDLKRNLAECQSQLEKEEHKNKKLIKKLNDMIDELKKLKEELEKKNRLNRHPEGLNQVQPTNPPPPPSPPPRAPSPDIDHHHHPRRFLFDFPSGYSFLERDSDSVNDTDESDFNELKKRILFSPYTEGPYDF